jgi:hypothetical protein
VAVSLASNLRSIWLKRVRGFISSSGKHQLGV